MFGVKSRQISQKYRLSVPITLEKGLSSLPVFLLCTMKLLVSSFHNLGKERSKNLQSLWLKDTFFSVQVSEVAQSCPTLCDPMDCILPGSSIDGIFQTKNTGVGCHFLLQEIFLTKGLNPGLPHCRQTLSRLGHQGIQRWGRTSEIRVFESCCLSTKAAL